MTATLDEDAKRLATHVRGHGGRALCVGGFVRDRLLGRDSKDLDVEVFGIPQDRLLPLLQSLGRVEPVGQAFPVYKFGTIDVALPRRESKTGRGHKGFTVEGDHTMSFEDAARRRDFTINAIAWDPLTDEYLDPFNGRRDLELRVLKVVDPATFADDSLRVLRALQFAARFELTIDPDTAEICSAISRCAFASSVAPAICRSTPSAVSSARMLRRSEGSATRFTRPSASRRSTSCVMLERTQLSLSASSPSVSGSPASASLVSAECLATDNPTSPSAFSSLSVMALAA